MAVAPVTILPGNVANNNETPLTAGFLLCSVLPAVRVGSVHTNICCSVTLKLQLLYRLHFEILRKQIQIENPKGYSRAVNMDGEYTGCCKTSVKLCKPFCDTFLGVVFVLF